MGVSAGGGVWAGQSGAAASRPAPLRTHARWGRPAPRSLLLVAPSGPTHPGVIPWTPRHTPGCPPSPNGNGFCKGTPGFGSPPDPPRISLPLSAHLEQAVVDVAPFGFPQGPALSKCSIVPQVCHTQVTITSPAVPQGTKALHAGNLWLQNPQVSASSVSPKLGIETDNQQIPHPCSRRARRVPQVCVCLELR